MSPGDPGSPLFIVLFLVHGFHIQDCLMFQMTAGVPPITSAFQLEVGACVSVESLPAIEVAPKATNSHLLELPGCKVEYFICSLGGLKK